MAPMGLVGHNNILLSEINKMARLILPSAGKALRFNGILKELLPIDESGITILENAALNGLMHFAIDEIVVVTNTFKEPYHRHILEKSPVSQVPLHFIVQSGVEVWGAIKNSIDPDQDSVLLLPDTVIQLPTGRVQITSDFMLGLFLTSEPERFSTLIDGRIRTKVYGGEFAWGGIYWSDDVGKELLQSQATHYDDAFNEIIRARGYTSFPIYKYHDLGSMNHYIQYLQELKSLTKKK